MMNGAMMKQAVYALNDYMKSIGGGVDGEAVADIVATHAIATAVSAAASGVIPGAGGAIAFGIACTSTMAMYGRLAGVIGVRLDSGLIKALASAVVADLAAAVSATIAVSAAISFIPGVGSMGAATLTAITNFCFVYMAGIIFIKMIVALGIPGIESMSKEELEKEAKRIQNEMDIKKAMKEAKAAYKNS